MFTSPMRRRLFAVVLAALWLTVTWVVRAATDPVPASTPAASSSAASSAATAPPIPATAPDQPIADYATHLPITGVPSPFHHSVASRYNYAFGKDTPFLPSNATTFNGQFLNPAISTPPNTAAIAIRRPTTSGAQSVHSNSFRAPWYLKNVNMLIDEKGVQYSRHCEGCHNPVALLLRRSVPGNAQEAPL